ncbi:MAG: signal peptidase II [Desulfuromonadaceae bacterium]|nr:signal peptidase II [Desulfuromonadaceae bacterium]
MRHYRLLLLVCLIVIPLDQWTKSLVVEHFYLHQSRTLIEPVLNLCYVLNTGAAFGLLADNGLRVPLLSAVALIATGVILWILPRLKPVHIWQKLGLSLVFSGALGNLIDRLRLGAVIDFIDVHWYQHHWPAFNVADSAITLGVIFLLLDLWWVERNRRQEEAQG